MADARHPFTSAWLKRREQRFGNFPALYDATGRDQPDIWQAWFFEAPAGATTLTATPVVNVSTFGAHSVTQRLTAAAVANTSTFGTHKANHRLSAATVVNMSSFGAHVVGDGSAPLPAPVNRLSRPLARALSRKLAA